jgi:hypothetical protein
MIEVRKEVLAATDGKQVPWDHSALTGDFYFHPVSAPGALPKLAPPAPGAEAEAMERRIKELEAEVKRKSDPAQTTRLIDLANLKERVRQLEVANQSDQQRIFDTYRKFGPVSDANARMSLNREIGDIQLQMARRGQEMKTLREQLSKLETEAGIGPQSGDSAQK